MNTVVDDDIQPKAVMTWEEEARWSELSPSQQLVRLGAAIQRGIDSGSSVLTMDQIWPVYASVMATPGYKLSLEAVRDIESIGDYGFLTFGLTQALKYHLALESRFELLAQFPRMGIPTYDLRPGLYRYPYGSHTIFYTIEPDHVFIVRVLYSGADFKRHF